MRRIYKRSKLPIGDTRKVSIYLPAKIREDVERQADRTDRSISWLMQQAWTIARPALDELPSVELFRKEQGTP